MTRPACCPRNSDGAAGWGYHPGVPSEYAEFLESTVRSRIDMSVAEFPERFLAGSLDEGDPDVPMLAGLLLIGQNGHRSHPA